MKYLRNAIFISLFLLTAACTSSNSVSGQSTNNNYDREFREQTRSSTTNYQQGNQLSEEAEGDPIVSLMLVALETGDLFPGDDYYVYAVVDSPRERDDIEYVWSIDNGDLHEVEESERGRLETLVETEYATANSGGQPPATTPDGVEGTDDIPGSGSTNPAGGTSTPGVGSPGVGGAGAGNPFGGSGGGSGSRPGSKDEPVKVDENFQLKQEDLDQMSPQERSEYESKIGGPPVVAEISSVNKEESSTKSPEESEVEDEKKDKGSEEETKSADPKKEEQDPKKDEPEKVSFILERRILAGPDDDPIEKSSPDTEEVEDTEGTDTTELSPSEKLDLNIEEAAARVAGLSTQVRPGQTAEKSADAEASSFGSIDEPVIGEGGNLLRYEYETWKEDGNEKNRRPLAGYGSGRESERLTWEESSEARTFVTDDPYILWTPEIPGETSIYVQVRYKTDILTEPMELPVSIRLKDPAVSLSEDFPDVVREDEAVYLELNAENIPAFDKGLFTIQFDPIKLSFRDAELGEFFDDSPASSIYFAQPDKTQGRVLLAVDTNSTILDISGDGVLAYVKFKAKEDLREREETGLMLIADTSARYVLNKDGENVLPLPVQNPPYRTGTIMPPNQPAFDRENTPGTEAPSQNGGQKPGTSQPRPGGNGTANVQTYGAGTGTAPRGNPNPPANTGTPSGGNTNPGAYIPPSTPATGTQDPVPVIPPPDPNPGNNPGASIFGIWRPTGPPTDLHVTAGVGGESEWLTGKFTGSGDMNSDYFLLDQGLAVFTFDMPGIGQANAVLKDSNGSTIGRLFSGESPVGSRAFGIPAQGEYVLEVVSYDDWEIACWQPWVEVASELRSFKGEGTAASMFTSLQSGVNYFRMSHQGNLNFTVLLLNYEGVPVKTLVSTVGNYNDVVEFDVPENGTFVLDVIAFSPWEIIIE